MADVTIKDTIYRFLRFVETWPHDPCWKWIGSRASGYGRFSFNGKQEGAHRVSYILFKGSIPRHLEVMHSCDNPRCVNPAHLSTGTKSDNMKDMFMRGRPGMNAVARRRAKTHCINGHEYTEANILWNKRRGVVRGRDCRVCHNIRNKSRV